MIVTAKNDQNETIWINESDCEFVFLGSVCEPTEFGDPSVCNAIACQKARFAEAGIELLDKEDTGWYCQYNFITWWNQDGYAMMFASREVLNALAHHQEMEADKTRVLPFATIEELEFGEGDLAEMFRKFWYYNIPNQPHHSTDKWVWKVRDQAGECVEARDYHKLFKVCRAASLKASCDEAVDAIAHIWDAMATCLYFMGVDTNHPYNLAEG
jgi:hypothetical protein